MINRLIYTLYLVSRKRKLGQHYLMSGGSAFFLLYINCLSIWMIVGCLTGTDFFDGFVRNEKMILLLTIVGFFGAQLYAKTVIKNNFKNVAAIRKIASINVLLYAFASVASLFIAMAVAAKYR